ncbi:MAG TPA: glycosyltransferase, partial [Streptosporangiaceae bacterium]|nr:glycosyltransferase [Streptosporangiaceae bacterium]
MLTTAAAAAWLYLLVLHGGYWRTSHRLPPGPPGRLPAVTVVIPARNEADMLPGCLPSLLTQDYSGRLRVIVVDDDSSDGTAKVAAGIGDAAAADPPAAELTV